MLNYKQAIIYLESLTDYEKSPAARYDAANFDLRRMELLLGELGNPHMGRRTVHIAGTKGKGSTAAMTASILNAAGYCTGLFTSPHLHSWQERIAIDGRPIAQKDFARLIYSLRPQVEIINTAERFGRLTTFEVLTAIAFLYFREKSASFQVLETGMGGRLDATNIVEPDVCIITSISLDHTQVLGDTLAKIAGEKAGIIKPGCTVISAPQSTSAAAIIRAKCRSLDAKLIQAGKNIKWSPVSSSLNGQHFRVDGMLRKYRLSLALLGDFQMENAALAIAAMEVLQKLDINIRYRDIVNGISSAKWPARMQVVSRSPLIIIDGAHNPYSIRCLIESIRNSIAYSKAVVIFGSSSDKDISGMGKELEGFAHRVIVTSSRHARAASADYIIGKLGHVKLNLWQVRSASESLSAAIKMAGKNDLILATGSLFLAAEIQNAFSKSDKSA